MALDCVFIRKVFYLRGWFCPSPPGRPPPFGCGGGISLSWRHWGPQRAALELCCVEWWWGGHTAEEPPGMIKKQTEWKIEPGRAPPSSPPLFPSTIEFENSPLSMHFFFPTGHCWLMLSFQMLSGEFLWLPRFIRCGGWVSNACVANVQWWKK